VPVGHPVLCASISSLFKVQKQDQDAKNKKQFDELQRQMDNGISQGSLGMRAYNGRVLISSS